MFNYSQTLHLVEDVGQIVNSAQKSFITSSQGSRLKNLVFISRVSVACTGSIKQKVWSIFSLPGANVTKHCRSLRIFVIS